MAVNGTLGGLDMHGRLGSATGPNGARVEKRQFYSSDNSPVEITVAVFDYDERKGVMNPEMIWALPLPYAYQNGAGLSLALVYAVDNIASGAVVWEVAACVARMSQSGETFALLDWGTPAEASADTVPATAGQFKGVIAGVAESAIGLSGSSTAEGSTQQMLFIRLRRKNTSSSDTLKAAALLFGAELLEGVP